MKREEGADRLSGVRDANNPARFCARSKPEIFQEFFRRRRFSGKAKDFASGVKRLGRFRPRSLPPKICPHSVTALRRWRARLRQKRFAPRNTPFSAALARGGRSLWLLPGSCLSYTMCVSAVGHRSSSLRPLSLSIDRSKVTIADTYPPTYAEFNVPSIAGTRFVIRKATDWTDFPSLRSALANRPLNSYRVLPI